MTRTQQLPRRRAVHIQADSALLQGDLTIPAKARGVVLFAHGSGSGRHSPRNRFVARMLNESAFATLLLDLLTEKEESAEAATGQLRFDIDFLADRLVVATDWLARESLTSNLPIGYFGASTGGVALVAAVQRPERARAIVSRGGRPDLAGPVLPHVQAPTLLLVGGHDDAVIDLNRQALEQLDCPRKQLVIVPGATHLFEEPGTLDDVVRLASDWFVHHLHAA